MNKPTDFIRSSLSEYMINNSSIRPHRIVTKRVVTVIDDYGRPHRVVVDVRN